jgi:hypothetical protein
LKTFTLTIFLFIFFLFFLQSHMDEHSDREDDLRDCDSSDEGVNVNHQNNTLMSGMDFGRSPEHNSDSHMKYVNNVIIVCLGFLTFFVRFAEKFRRKCLFRTVSTFVLWAFRNLISYSFSGQFIAKHCFSLLL